MQIGPVFTSGFNERSAFVYRLYLMVLLTPVGLLLTQSVSDLVLRLVFLFIWTIAVFVVGRRVLRPQQWSIFEDRLEFYRDSTLREVISLHDIVSMTGWGDPGESSITLTLTSGQSRVIHVEDPTTFKAVLESMLLKQ